MTRAAWLGVVLAAGLVGVVLVMRARAAAGMLAPVPSLASPEPAGSLERIANIAQRAIGVGGAVAGTIASVTGGGGAAAATADTAATTTTAAVPTATAITDGGSLAGAGVGVGGVLASVAVIGGLVAFTAWVISWHGSGIAFQKEQDRRKRQLNDYVKAAEAELGTTIPELAQYYQIGFNWLFLDDYLYNAAAGGDSTVAAGDAILDLVARAKRGALVPHTPETLEAQEVAFQAQLDERARLARLALTNNVFASEAEAAAAGFGEGQY